jgi:hypothetical protein
MAIAAPKPVVIASSAEQLGASFRDPAGFVFQRDGVL